MIRQSDLDLIHDETAFNPVPLPPHPQLRKAMKDWKGLLIIFLAVFAPALALAVWS